MDKKYLSTRQTQSLNSEVFNWCVSNDFQVYLKPTMDSGKGQYRIAVRRLGITTGGKDYVYKDDNKVESYEVIGNKIFKNVAEASEHIWVVMENLKKKYG